MDLLNLHQPWDCERFPKSKTICYGGGGGGGGSVPTSTGDIPLVKKAAKKTGYTGSDLDKTGQKVEKEGTKATKHVKKETKKLASGDYSLKKSVQGTASGASETFKKSDAGKVVKKIAKETGYTGSDADKALQKTEKEVGNIGNQTLDVVNNPGKAVLDLADKGSKYVKRQLGVNVPSSKELLDQGLDSVSQALQKKPTETKAGPGGAVSIGGGKGLGSGAVQGLQGGAGLDTNRARAKQNKRKLRIR